MITLLLYSIYNYGPTMVVYMGEDWQRIKDYKTWLSILWWQRTFLKEKQCQKILATVTNYRKVEHEQWRFDEMEAWSTTCFNTGNLVFKDWEDQSGKRPSSWYHQQLNKERIKKWKTPLIIPATLPDQTEMLSVIVDAFKTAFIYVIHLFHE